MKAILFLLLIALPFSGVKGQNVLLNDTTFRQKEHFVSYNKYDSLERIYKYNYHRKGSGGMITGGVIMAGGGILLLSGSIQNSLGYFLLGYIVAGTGADIFIISSIVYLCNKNNSSYEQKRYSIVGNKNQLGLAYNFR